MKTINTKWKAAIGIILTMILTLMLLTIIYWLFIEQQIETRSHRVLVTFPPRVSHDGNDLWWNVPAPCTDKTLYLLVEGID